MLRTLLISYLTTLSANGYSLALPAPVSIKLVFSIDTGNLNLFSHYPTLLKTSAAAA